MFLIASIIVPNKFWLLLSLILVVPYASVKSEVLYLQLIFCVAGAQDSCLYDFVSIRFHVYMILNRRGQWTKS